MSNFCLKNRNIFKNWLKKLKFLENLPENNRFFFKICLKNLNFSKICQKNRNCLWNFLKKIEISRKFAWKNRHFVVTDPRPPRFQTRLTPLNDIYNQTLWNWEKFGRTVGVFKHCLSLSQIASVTTYMYMKRINLLLIALSIDWLTKDNQLCAERDQVTCTWFQGRTTIDTSVTRGSGIGVEGHESGIFSFNAILWNAAGLSVVLEYLLFQFIRNSVRQPTAEGVFRIISAFHLHSLTSNNCCVARDSDWRAVNWRKVNDVLR